MKHDDLPIEFADKPKKIPDWVVDLIGWTATVFAIISMYNALVAIMRLF